MATNLYNTIYNPDVLSCIANLSNDEVFTPPEVANAMLDLLPQELFSDPNTTFLDPACKSGVFLREIAKRLLKGLEPIYPDLQERTEHIFKKQLFGIAITELTAYLSRRSLYCSKFANGRYSVVPFENVDGNVRFKHIQHRWKDGRCVFCGASQKEYDRAADLETHAYELIHTIHPEEIFKMKFDVIISNPPYQLSTGGGSEKAVAARQAKPLFHLFVQQAKRLNPRYLSMIIPARWYSGGIGLNEFRDSMLHDRHLSTLVDYVNSKDCFDGVDIAGGICYFLWERDRTGKCKVINKAGSDVVEEFRNLDEFGDIFIRANQATSIIHKIKMHCSHFLDEQVYPIDAFGFPSKARGSTVSIPNGIKLLHSQGVGYVSRSEVKKNADIIDKYKATISILVPCNGEVGIDPSKGYKSITTPRILYPGEITTFSYLVLGAFDTEKEVINFKKYMLTKFARFMLRVTFSSMHIAKANFILVPKMDFNEEWSDKTLSQFFGLTENEVDYIDRTMRSMENDEEGDE